MVQTHLKKKIEIIIDATAVKKVVAVAERAGANGYTVVPHVTGRGHRGKRAHDIFEDAQNAMIIIVSSEAVVLRILDEVMSLLESYAGIAYVMDVHVARPDHF